ncbi:hypothetical protein [Litorihabitans aurantiacus]|uniref:hypothetical protein n=1 Tax=Litorihabitans aurantiacus TaxID=1930061 RepID=UPI0024E0C47B|nr:hypothetical protein [Litorihabitans aurantiacus]
MSTITPRVGAPASLVGVAADAVVRPRREPAPALLTLTLAVLATDLALFAVVRGAAPAAPALVARTLALAVALALSATVLTAVVRARRARSGGKGPTSGPAGPADAVGRAPALLALAGLSLVAAAAGLLLQGRVLGMTDPVTELLATHGAALLLALLAPRLVGHPAAPRRFTSAVDLPFR